MVVNEILPVLGDRLVKERHYGDIQKLHDMVTASGRSVRANRVLSVASKMFALSLKPMAGEDKPWRDAAKGNPCRGIRRNSEEGRERFFSSAELAALSDALAEHDTPAADCLRLLMLTGADPARRCAPDGANSTPSPDIGPSRLSTRNRKSPTRFHSARPPRINRQAPAQASRRRVRVSGPDKGKPVRELRRVWAAVTRAAGLEGALVYTLRHSFASIGAGGGLSLQIIGKLLGHTVSRTTERYAHLSGDALEEAVGRIGAAIAGGGKDAGNVVTPQWPQRGGK